MWASEESRAGSSVAVRVSSEYSGHCREKDLEAGVEYWSWSVAAFRVSVSREGANREPTWTEKSIVRSRDPCHRRFISVCRSLTFFSNSVVPYQAIDSSDALKTAWITCSIVYERVCLVGYDKKNIDGESRCVLLFVFPIARSHLIYHGGNVILRRLPKKDVKSGRLKDVKPGVLIFCRTHTRLHCESLAQTTFTD
jgi:hypothetical protein